MQNAESIQIIILLSSSTTSVFTNNHCPHLKQFDKTKKAQQAMSILETI